MVSTEELKSAITRINSVYGKDTVTYKDLQKELGGISLKDLDEALKQLMEAFPDFGEIDDNGTAKKSDNLFLIFNPIETEKIIASNTKKSSEKTYERSQPKNETKSNTSTSTQPSSQLSDKPIAQGSKKIESPKKIGSVKVPNKALQEKKRMRLTIRSKRKIDREKRPMLWDVLTERLRS
jgi:hypothetical protein